MIFNEGVDLSDIIVENEFVLYFTRYSPGIFSCADAFDDAIAIVETIAPIINRPEID